MDVERQALGVVLLRLGQILRGTEPNWIADGVGVGGEMVGMGEWRCSGVKAKPSPAQIRALVLHGTQIRTPHYWTLNLWWSQEKRAGGGKSGR